MRWRRKKSFDSLFVKANSVVYNGVSSYAQSDDVVAKTAYNGTVSWGVSISSDWDWPYISFVWASSWKLTNATANPSVIATNFTCMIKFKTWSDVSNFQILFNNIIWWSDRVAMSIRSWEVRVWVYNWSTYVWPKSITVTANTLYEWYWTYTASWNVSVFVLNWVTASGTNTPAATSIVSFYVWWYTTNYLTWFIYYMRLYSDAISGTELSSELALWSKQSTNSKLVLEYNPLFFAWTAGTPTAIYDVKAFTQYTPHIVYVKYQSAGNWLPTWWLVWLPYSSLVDDDWLTWTNIVVASSRILNWSLTVKLWLNWVEQVISGEFSSSWVKITDYIILWSTNWSSDFFEGKILDVKIYAWILSDTEWESLSSWSYTILSDATLFTEPKILPPYSTTMTDLSWNWYDFTFNT